MAKVHRFELDGLTLAAPIDATMRAGKTDRKDNG
jgi:hypothetical protein